MKRIFLIVLLFTSISAFSQSKNDVITPENSGAKRKEQHDKIENEYLHKVEQHQEYQGKKGKRRMKKNMKKSQRMRRLGNLPWYKRMWVRRQ